LRKVSPVPPPNLATRNQHPNRFKKRKLNFFPHCNSCHAKLFDRGQDADVNTARVPLPTPTGGVPPEGAAQYVQHASQEHVDTRFDEIKSLAKTLNDKVNTLSQEVGAIRASIETIQCMLRATAAQLDLIGRRLIIPKSHDRRQ